jgi:hypothetical protein
MEFTDLIGRELRSLNLLNTGTHAAWVDNSTPQIATYAANLELVDSISVQVRPCEVPIPNQYPALGIEMIDWAEPPRIQRWPGGPEFSVSTPSDVVPFLPAIISDVHLWDSMGEGSVSAIDLVLSTGPTLTLRHVFPPMMLGLDVHPEGRAHDL